MSTTSKKIQDIKKAIEELTLLEQNELVKLCEQDWGVSAAAQVAAPSSAPVEAKTEKADLQVSLIAAGEKKIEVIKAVRQFMPNLDLLGAKKFVEDASAATPSVLGTFPKDKAKQIEDAIKAAGATVKVE
jgi:large subunit ribosomal protein L7/L12